MLLVLSQWLQGLSPEFGFFRVFQYLTFRAVMAAMTALLIGLVAGPKVIRMLTALKIVRIERAVRPCLPITFPTSEGATFKRRIVFSSRATACTSTACGSSTSALAISITNCCMSSCFSSNFMARSSEMPLPIAFLLRSETA